jgi:hypothetical protein
MRRTIRRRSPLDLEPPAERESGKVDPCAERKLWLPRQTAQHDTMKPRERFFLLAVVE